MRKPLFLFILWWLGSLIPETCAQFGNETVPHLPVFDRNDMETGRWMYEDDFEQYWPPRKQPKAYFEQSEKGQQEWEKFLAAQRKIFQEHKQNAPGSRAYPFCVDGKNADGTIVRDLENFIPLLTPAVAEPQDGNILVADDKGIARRIARGKALIGSVQFKSIVSPDNNARIRGIGRLNSWVHIVVKTRDPNIRLKGLLIQSISGPMGLPFGEFRNDFDCKLDKHPSPYEDYRVNKYVQITDHSDYDEKTRNKQVIHILPCKYRHGHGIKHSTIFAYGGRKNATEGPNKLKWEQPARNIFRVHFNWEDLQCNSAGAMQFLIMAVRDFSDTSLSSLQIFRTAAYLQRPDSPDGIAYPYHPVWRNSMQCVGDLVDDTQNGKTNPRSQRFEFKSGFSNYPIQYHSQYDNCIWKNIGLDNASRMCPPGPFWCDRIAKDATEFNNKTRLDVTSSGSTCNLTYCIDPLLTEPRLDRNFPDRWSTRILLDIAKNADSIGRKSKSFHAYVMSIAWILLIGIGAFTARYVKETAGLNPMAGNGCLGLGYWLWMHILIFYAAFALIWAGVFEVSNIHAGKTSCEDYQKALNNSDYLGYGISNYTTPGRNKDALVEDCEHKVKGITAHVSSGWLSVLLFHVAFCTGWYRPTDNYKRNVMIYVHFIIGYAGQILSFISAMLLYIAWYTVCIDICVELVLHEVVTIAAFVVAIFIQRIEDKRIKRKDRAEFPVNEGLEVPEEKSILVLSVAGVTYFLQLLLMLLIFLSYKFISNGGRIIHGNPVGNNETKPMNFDIAYGIFGGGAVKDGGELYHGQCRMPSIELNAFITKHRYVDKKPL